MWFYFNKSKFYDTEFNNISNLLKSYLKSIDIPLYSAANSEKTEYEKNLKKIQDYFKKSKNCSEKIRDFNNYLRFAIKEISEIKKIINNNLEIEKYLEDYESFISYNDLEKTKYKFSKSFVEILKELDKEIWKYLSSKDNGSVKNQYYEMLYKALDDKIYCPFCGINRLKNPKGKDKVSPLEHFIPKAKYPFVAWNTDNIFLSCEDCNSKKGEKVLEEKNLKFFPIGVDINPEIKLRLASYDLIVEEDSSMDSDNCRIEFILKNISIGDFSKYLSTWNHLFSIEDRLKENLISYIKKKEIEFKMKKRLNSNFDFSTEIKVELKEAEKDGKIIKIAYLKYKEEELKED